MSSGQFLLSHKTIADIIDSRAGIKEILNFPLTISLEEPEPVKKGHIWIQTDQEINNILIRKYLPLTAEVNDVCIICYQKLETEYNVSHEKVDSENNLHYVSAILGTAQDDSLILPISEIDDDVHSLFYMPNPRMIFIKTENSWDLINAFYYNGSEWIQFGLSDKIFVTLGPSESDKSEGLNKSLKSYYFNGTNIEFLQDFDVSFISNYPYIGYNNNALQSTLLGKYFTIMAGFFYIFKRDGCMFSYYDTIRPDLEDEATTSKIAEDIELVPPVGNNKYGEFMYYNTDTPVILNDSGTEAYTFVFKIYRYADGDSLDRGTYFLKYVNNGTKFVYDSCILKFSSSVPESVTSSCIVQTLDCKIIIVKFSMSYYILYRNEDGSYSIGSGESFVALFKTEAAYLKIKNYKFCKVLIGKDDSGKITKEETDLLINYSNRIYNSIIFYGYNSNEYLIYAYPRGSNYPFKLSDGSSGGIFIYNLNTSEKISFTVTKNNAVYGGNENYCQFNITNDAKYLYAFLKTSGVEIFEINWTSDTSIEFVFVTSIDEPKGQEPYNMFPNIEPIN